MDKNNEYHRNNIFTTAGAHNKHEITKTDQSARKVKNYMGSIYNK